MKKITILLMMMLIIITVFTVTACNTDSTDTTDTTSVSATVMFMDADCNLLFSATEQTEAEYLADFIDEVIGDEVTYYADDSGYGLYMYNFTIDGVTYGTGTNEFVAMYTSIDDINYISVGYETTIDGVTYYFCGYGMSSMPIEDGVVYILMLGTW